MRFDFVILILLIVVAGIIALQVFLSKAENKWLGLLLPAINLFFSLVAVFGLTMFTSSEVVQDGKAISIVSTFNHDSLGMVFTAFYVFFLYNIPTFLLLAIYFTCRGARKRNLALEKMKVQDLE